MNIPDLFTPVVITELEVRCEDLEFERDVFCEAFCREITIAAQQELKGIRNNE